MSCSFLLQNVSPKCDDFDEADGGTESYLFKDYSIDCSTARYEVFFWYSVMMILIYPIGIPLGYYVLLRGHRDTLSDPEAMAREMAYHNPTTGHLEFLISAYKEDFYW